jgi:hypothetical protein
MGVTVGIFLASILLKETRYLVYVRYLCETYDLTSFMANPAAKMMKNIRKLVCVSLGYFPQHFKQFLRNISITIYQNFVMFLSLRTLKNLSDSKSMRVTSLTYMLGEFQCRSFE